MKMRIAKINIGKFVRMWHERHKMKVIGRMTLGDMLTVSICMAGVPERVLIERLQIYKNEFLESCVDQGYIRTKTPDKRYKSLVGYCLTEKAYTLFVQKNLDSYYYFERGYKKVSIEQVEAEIAQYYALRGEVNENLFTA